MKKLILLLFSIAIVFNVSSQTKRCGTDEILEKYLEANPSERVRFNQWQDDLTNGVLTKGVKRSKTAKYTIPVVVHVMHFEGEGNISREQIEDGLRVLNEDFQKLNADTADTRNLFKSVAADVDIEFKLANKAPDSSCTTGIVRVNSFSTFDFDDDDKSISHWNSNNYFNVWLVEDISEGGSGGNILGYAQFPFAFGSPNYNIDTYGIVVLNSEWGTIGTAVDASIPGGRTATHEVGHCLNLLHTFQNTFINQNGCGGDCRTTGDRVCDTPPVAQAANFDCDTTSNTCSNDTQGGSSTNPNPYTSNVVDQVENYMGYDDCQTLFTEGQKDRMHDALTTASHLITLVSASNLVATGTDNGHVVDFCPPVAEMYLVEQLICKGDSLTFSDDSYGDTIVDYKWIFPGATPDTSLLANPTVTYNTSGIHDVTLIVTNSAGSDTLTIPDVIVVGDSNEAIAAFDYKESFESLSTFGSSWRVISPSAGPQWQRVRRSYDGNYSAYLENFRNEAREKDFFVSPLFDMTTVVNPEIEFRVANKTVDGASLDALFCEVSTDCGATWNLRRGLTTRNISSGTINNSYFPSASDTADWKKYTISLNADQRNSPNLRFRFSFTSGGGNNIYIDDFRITGTSSTVGLPTIEENVFDLTIYPNPTQGENTYVGVFLDKSQIGSLYLTDIMGKRVIDLHQGLINGNEHWFNIDNTSLSSGIYFLTFETEGRRTTKKLIVR